MSAIALFDDGAELAVLGAVMVRNEAIDDLADLLEPEHFRRDAHRVVYAAMRTLHATGQPIDPVTVSDQLTRDGVLEQVGRPFIYGLGDGVATSTNVLAYARTVRDKALIRTLLDICRKTAAECEAGAKSGALLLEETEQAVYRLSSTAVRTDWVSAEELAGELYAVVEQLTNTGKPLTGLSTGFNDIDRLTRGLQNGDLVLLGARPSQGKTALALQVAMTAAAHGPVAFFSVEMARQPLGLRAVIAAARVDGYRMLSGWLNEIEMRYVSDGLSRLGELHLYFDESPTLSPVHVRSKLRRLKSRTGTLGLVVIDYLQLMASLPEHRSENRTTQVAGISRALKILAREFGCPFLVLSQLSRAVERSAEKRPTLSDLRESGALEQDADVVLLIHRPEVYEKTAENEGQAEIIIAKQRNGPIGMVPLLWRGAQMRFEAKAESGLL